MVEYSCLHCNFKTNIKTHYTRHLQTNKHKNNEIKAKKNLPRITTYNHGLPRITTSPKINDKNTQKYVSTVHLLMVLKYVNL